MFFLVDFIIIITSTDNYIFFMFDYIYKLG